MISIPIPENVRHKVRTRYEDLGTQGDLQLPESLANPSGPPTPLRGSVHLDPDIRPSLRPKFCSAKCADMHLYGQDNASQTHLTNEGIEPGDLFLFFGLFREARWESACARFERSAKMKHVIWGWLQVGARYPLSGSAVPDPLKWAGHHPHLDCRDRVNNCIYVGARKLSFAPRVDGAGVFEKYRDQLRLTQSGESRCSFWALPAFFGQAGMTFHDLKTWRREGDQILGQSVGRGQEFVIRTAGVESECIAWLGKLFAAATRVN